MPSDALRILEWNASGLQGKGEELLALAEELRIDVLLVAETHLREGITFSLRNYFCYRVDRTVHVGGRPAGGTACFVHRRVAHRPVEIATRALELTCVHAYFSGMEVRLVAAYNKPTQPIPAQDLDSVFDTTLPVVLMGDLNCKHLAWNSRVANRRGRTLFNYTSRKGCVVVGPETPTFVHRTGAYRPDVLDIAILKGVPYAYEMRTIEDLSSDHSPVLLDLLGVRDSPDPPQALQVHWRKFGEALARDHRSLAIGTLVDRAGIEQALDGLTKEIQQALSSSTQTRRPVDRRDKLPLIVNEALAEKRRLRRLYRLTLDPAVKRQFNTQSARVKQLLLSFREDSWFRFLESIADDNCSIFRLNKRLRRGKAPKTPLHGQQGLAYAESDKAEAFADTLEVQFSPNAEVYDDDQLEEVEDFLSGYFGDETAGDPPLDPEMTRVEEEEVRAAIRAAKPDKAPGLDGIRGRALRFAPPAVITSIAALFSAIIATGYYPREWKTAKIVCFPKPGKDPLFPQNYRPISLLAVLSKAFERVLLSRIRPFLEGDIRPEQFGFRTGHSTTGQVARLVSCVADGFNRKMVTATVFLDISKAFDKVWHAGLVYKLATSSLPPRIVRLLASYLDGRQFVVSVGNALSAPRAITAGVPQGAVLSPLLYTVYTNDMPCIQGVNAALYADDTAYYFRSPNRGFAVRRLQQQLDELEPWLEKWRIQVNGEKSVAVIFQPSYSRGRQHEQQLQICGKSVPYRDSAKYLGVILDRRLTLIEHARSVVMRAKAARAVLYPVLNSRSPIPVSIRLLIFRLYVLPILTYAFPAWGALLVSECWRKKIEAVQNIALRTIFGAPWFVRNDVLRNDAEFLTVRQQGRKLSARFYETAAASRFPLMQELRPDVSYPQRRRRLPHAVLDEPP